MITQPISNELKIKLLDEVRKTSGPFPIVKQLKKSQVKINEIDIIAVVEILNHSEDHRLPQMCMHESKERTPLGLDRELKFYTDNDLSRANYVSDILLNSRVVKIKNITSPFTGEEVKGTILRQEWCW